MRFLDRLGDVGRLLTVGADPLGRRLDRVEIELAEVRHRRAAEPLQRVLRLLGVDAALDQHAGRRPGERRTARDQRDPAFEAAVAIELPVDFVWSIAASVSDCGLGWLRGFDREVEPVRFELELEVFRFDAELLLAVEPLAREPLRLVASSSLIWSFAPYPRLSPVRVVSFLVVP